MVASKGGDDKPPAWLLNLEADPEVEIQIGRDKQKGRCRVLDPSDPDYARLWKIVNDNNANRYSAYQQLTSRPIRSPRSCRSEQSSPAKGDPDCRHFL